MSIVAPVLVFNVQLPIGWLNADAFWNIALKFVKLLGVHPLIDGEPPLLNPVQVWNIYDVFVTLLTFQLPMS